MLNQCASIFSWGKFRVMWIYRLDMHGSSQVALSGRLFPEEALTTRLNSFRFSLSSLISPWLIFHYSFAKFSNIHNYSTWQSMKLSLPNVTQNFGKRTFLFTGAKIFNKLSINIEKSENIQTFCRRAKHFFLSWLWCFIIF